MLRKREHVRRWYRRVLELRRRTYALLEHGPASDQASVFVDRFLIGLIIINLAAVILDSVPWRAGRDPGALTHNERG
jgi:hypothetical protein